MALTEQQIRDIISINLQPGSKITAEKHKQVENSIVDAIFELKADFEDTSMLYEVKELDIPSNAFSSFLSTNFESGKGIAGTKFEKWAICNGDNFTQNRVGKVAIGYGGGYVLGATGGVESVILNESEMPIHSHSIANNTGNFSSIGGLAPVAYNPPFTSSINSGDTGGNQPHTNMQPYIVTLFIQRIAV